MPIGLRPDLGASGRLMRRAVGQVVELVGPDRAHLLGQAAAEMHVVAGVGIGLGRNEAQVGADHAEEVDLLPTLGLGHHDHGAIAARIGHQRDADAGIARRALDDRAAGLEQAAGFGIEDDAEPCAVLHRAAGVHELGLAQDLAAGGLAGAAQADQRRVADRALEAIHDAGRGRGDCVHDRIFPGTQGMVGCRAGPGKGHETLSPWLPVHERSCLK